MITDTVIEAFNQLVARKTTTPPLSSYSTIPVCITPRLQKENIGADVISHASELLIGLLARVECDRASVDADEVSMATFKFVPDV